MRLFKKNFLVWFILLVFIFIIFRKFFLDGMIPMPADILIGGYYPWLDSKWGFPVSVPVKNSLPADIISIMYPWRVLGMKLIKEGILPLWDDTILLGVPLLANFQAALLNPLNILYFVLSNPLSWGIQIIIQPILMVAGMFFFLRQLELSKESSIFGGILYAFSGFALVWLPYNTINYTLAFFPLILFAIEKVMSTQKLIWGVLISVFLTLQVFSGYPLSVFYTLLFGGIYFLWRIVGREKKLIKLSIVGIGVLLGLAISGIQLLPGLELSGLSIRNLDKSAVAGDVKYLPVSHLVTFFAPDFFGNPGTANYFSIGSYDNFAFFLAAPGIFFLIISIVTKKAFEKRNLIFLVFAVVGLLYATNNPVSKLLATSFFGLDASVNTRILFVFTFSVSVLSAIGFEHATQKGLRFWQRMLPFVGYAIIVAGVGLGYFYLKRISSSLEAQVVDNHYLKWLTEVERQGFTNTLVNLKITFRNLAVPSAIILATTISSFFKNKKYLLILISILTLYSTKTVFDKYTSFIKPDLVFPTMPAIEELKKLTGNNRFDMEEAEIFPANSWSVYGLKTAAGQDSLGLLSTARYMNLINTQSTKDEILTRFVPIKKHDYPLFDTLNISHFAALDRDVKESIPSQSGRPFPWIIPGDFREVANIDTVRIYENTNNMGPAWFAKEIICEKNWEKASEKLNEKTYNPKDSVFVDCDNSGMAVKAVGTTKLVEQRSNYVKFEVDTPVENYLTISHSIYPGWEVYVDGKKSDIKTSNVALMGILIPSGSHKVELSYNPQSVKNGAILSLTGLGVWGAILGSSKIVKGKKWQKN